MLQSMHLEASRRVAITGIGIVSPFGSGKRAALDALRAGRSGIRAIESMDATALNCRIAGEVPASAHEGLHLGHDRFTRFALIATDEAAAESGTLTAAPERVGALIGTGLGGCETLDDGYRRLYRDGGRIPPLSIPMSMYNAAPAAVSRAVNARGLSWSIVSACASSAHAIGLAAQSIRAGQADAIFAGGSDAPLTPGIIRAWESLRVLAIDNERPEEACRPFSADRKGLVLAEGAAIFILERMDLAMKRGAAIVAEVLGFGATSDAGHVTDPSADGAERAMRLALDDARLEPADVHYINAHGTGTRANDPTESLAIRNVFGAETPPVSSTKSMHGHAMGASGALEIASAIISLREGFLPPTLNLHEPDAACAMNHIANQPRETRGDTFLSNSFGFGGMNAALVIRTTITQ
jgi:nodulation protein E